MLPFSEFNPAAKVTILFIHGAFSEGAEWDLVAPRLPDYHLLLPDLPGHGKAYENRPFSKRRAAKLLAKLITTNGHDGKAHVIGLSLGAYVAVELASQYPNVVEDMFLSGFKGMPQQMNNSIAPYAFYLEQRFENTLPRSLTRWLMDGTDIRVTDSSRSSVQLCREVLGTPSAGDTNEQWPSAWPARTLIVAAGKAGLVPSSDSVADTVNMRDVGRKMNEETVAYVHSEMRHPWNRQAPELFAKTAKAWFQREAIPTGFKEL